MRGFKRLEFRKFLKSIEDNTRIIKEIKLNNKVFIVL